MAFFNKLTQLCSTSWTKISSPLRNKIEQLRADARKTLSSPRNKSRILYLKVKASEVIVYCFFLIIILLHVLQFILVLYYPDKIRGIYPPFSSSEYLGPPL